MWELHDSTKGDKYFIRRGFSWFIEAWYQLYNLCYINGVKNFGGKIEDQYDPTKNQCIQWRSLLISLKFNKNVFKEQTVHNLKRGIDASKGFQRFIDSSSEFGIPEKLWFIFKIGVSDYLINISACLIKFSFKLGGSIQNGISTKNEPIIVISIWEKKLLQWIQVRAARCSSVGHSSTYN